jgi:hypothetical protein
VKENTMAITKATETVSTFEVRDNEAVEHLRGEGSLTLCGIDTTDNQSFQNDVIDEKVTICRDCESVWINEGPETEA